MTTVEAKVKLWVFPALISLVSILVMGILNDVKNEIISLRTDVKALLTQSVQDKVRIDNLERRVQLLEARFFGETGVPLPASLPIKTQVETPLVAIRPEDEYLYTMPIVTKRLVSANL